MNHLGEYDVIVIGAGHAGIEAAHAAATLGAKTAVFTMSLDAIGNMPCNPSIGGTAKGTLVRELDALGGVMGLAADATYLQSRMLNKGKGPAVHALRVQTDRKRYHEYMKHALELTPGLAIHQAEVVGLEVENGRVKGIVTQLNGEYTAKCVVLATGTNLGGKIFVGDAWYASGPDGMHAANALTESLKAAGLPLPRQSACGVSVQPVHLLQHPLGLLDEVPSLFGGDHAGGRALKHADAVFLFQVLQCLAHVGLGGVHLLCRRAHRAPLHDGHQITKFRNIHAVPPFCVILFIVSIPLPHCQAAGAAKTRQRNLLHGGSRLRYNTIILTINAKERCAMPEYRVLRIEEQMYGCEELPAGQPVLCDVVLEGTDGACCTLPCPDKELTRLGIDEGSRVHLLPDGTLQKISEELL